MAMFSKKRYCCPRWFDRSQHATLDDLTDLNALIHVDYSHQPIYAAKQLRNGSAIWKEISDF